jgi:glycosyltransferase involved in cell wall biosynthesis
LKIAHCLNHFLPEHPAGTEVYVWALAKQMLRLGHDCMVIIPHYDSQRTDHYDYDGIKVHRYAEPSVPDRALITGQKTSEGLPHFRQWLKDHQPDILHFHEIAGSNGITVNHLEAAHEAGCRVILTLHLAGVTCRAGTLMLNTKTLCDGAIIINRCAHCVLVHKTGSAFRSAVLSAFSFPLYKAGIDTMKWQNKAGTALSFPSQIEKLKEDFNRIIACCDKIIPITDWYHKILLLNEVPPERMKIIRQALPSGEQVPVKTIKNHGFLNLVYIGRIDPLKGIDILLEAVMEIPAEKIHLDIYGSAPDANYMNHCLQLTSGHKNIRWKGVINPGISQEIISSYDALVLPSMFSEMSPLTIQEAFAASVPVIGSSVYGIMEQVHDGVNGLIFEFGNKESLISVLNKAIADPSLLSNMASYIIPPRHFEAVAQETLEAYAADTGNNPSFNS